MSLLKKELYGCIVNDKCVLKGIENSKVPDVKSDRIVEFIETHNNESILSEEQIQDIISSIKEHIVESN